MESPREVWTLILGSVEAPGQSLPIPRGVCGVLGGGRLEVLLGKANPAACSLELPPQTPGSASSKPWICLLKPLELPPRSPGSACFSRCRTRSSHQRTYFLAAWKPGSKTALLGKRVDEGKREESQKKRQEKATLPLGAGLERGREGAGVGRSFRIRKVKSRSEEIEWEVPGWCWWKGRAIAFFPSHSQKGAIWGVWNVGRV